MDQGDRKADDKRRERRREKRKPPPGGRAPWIVLGVAMALSAALILYESRGVTFFNDEFVLFDRFAGGFSVETILTPLSGHLIGTGSLIFDLGLSIFGAEPIVFRIIGILCLWALAAVLYAYLRRLVPLTLALAPAIVILFLGAAWEVLLWPMANINTCVSAAAGVGALLALETPAKRRDLAGCLLLILGLFTGTFALAFVAGAAVLVLSRPDRWARVWVLIVPLTLYAAWFVWSQRFDSETAGSFANIWLFPSYSLNSLAIVLAALTGLSASLASGDGLNPTVELDSGWGRVFAVAAVVGIGWRIVRGRLPNGFWAALAALGAFWFLAALGFGPDRTPVESRYILPGVVLVALVAGQALAGIRLPRATGAIVVVITLIAVATGIRQLHDGGLFLRDYSERARATLSGIEAAPSADPDYAPLNDPALADVVPRQLPVVSGPYLEAIKAHGSPAFSREELRDQPESVREIADRVRVAAIAAEAGVAPP